MSDGDDESTRKRRIHDVLIGSSIEEMNLTRLVSLAAQLMFLSSTRKLVLTRR
jgi:hypothetical protein